MPEKDFYQVSLKIILHNTKGEILLLKAQAGDTYAGYYDLPGGRIDKDEFTKAFTEIIAREVQEELGDIRYELNPRPVAVSRHLLPANAAKNRPEIHVLYLLYEAEYLGGDIHISAEHTAFARFDLTKEDPTKLLKSGNLEGVKVYLGNRKAV